MFDCKYKVYLNKIYFESFYGADYYQDKSNFFAHGAKQFFTIYQILRTGDFQLTIIKEISGERVELDNSNDFKNWVGQNYNYFINHLDSLYQNKQPGSEIE